MTTAVESLPTIDIASLILPGIALAPSAPGSPGVDSASVDTDDAPDEAGPRAQLEGAAAAKRFVLAGEAVFTVVSTKTGARFTYRVARGKEKTAPHFVAVLTGPSNTSDYSFLGTIFDGARYFHGKRSRIAPDAPSAKAFAFFWACVAQGSIPAVLEVHHEGRCGRCSRRLTTALSIVRGFGPECWEKVGGGS